MKVKVRITSFDERGRGTGKAEGGEEDIHIPFSYPGDTIEARIINRRKKEGKLLEVLNPSPLRQSPPCKYFGTCGGCSWQGMSYKNQLNSKEEIIRKLFGECSPILPSPQEYFYRNRMDYAFGPDFTLGLKDSRDNIINIDKCLLMSEKSNAIMHRLRYFVSLYKLRAYKEGIMRHAVIREGKNIDNVIVNILTSDKGAFPLEDFWEKMKDLINGATWSINLSPADRSYGEIQKCVGHDHLLESLAGIEYKIPVHSFFQTNTLQAENLIKMVREYLNLQGGEKVFDLYSGTGSIGLALAGTAKEIIGIEENASAVALSLENARLNHIANFSAMAGRVEDLIKSMDLKSDKMVLDPPRPGIHKKVLAKIISAGPKTVAYVSCNPYTQKQDVNQLIEGGYKIKKIQPLDMFPHTPHIENIILLEKRAGG